MIDEKALEAAATAICLSDGLNINEFLGGERASIFRHATKHARAAILAYESAKQKGEAEGWLLVPREPNSDQLDRAVAFALNVSLGGDYRWTDYMRDLYGRFLSAAPKPPTMLSAGGEGQ